MKIRFIVNPNAGGTNSTEEVSASVSNLFRNQSGIFEVRATKSTGHAYKLSEEARDKGYDIVFACGGDGTINEVASALVKSDVSLGIIPKGSGNGLARALTLPWDVDAAISLALRGKVKRVDVGRVDDRYFFATAGFGFDALISKIYDSKAKKSGKRGILPYFPIAMKEFMTYKPQSTKIRYDDKMMRVFPFLLTIANTEQYGGNAIIAPGAKPDDGLLDVCVVEDVSPMVALKLAFNMFKGRVDQLESFKRVLANTIEIVMEGSNHYVHADGEPFTSGERVKVSVVPKGLKVLVPKAGA